MYKPAMMAGALFAALSVILGAFCAHKLKEFVLPDQVAIFDKGVQYQFYHSFALLITGISWLSYPSRQLSLATTFFIIGITLFSGSLYAMVLLTTAGKSLGPFALMTPIGGLFFIMGWIALFWGIFKTK